MTFKNIRSLLRTNDFNLLDGNENLGNVNADKLYYVYASKDYKYLDSKKNNLTDNLYDFFYKLEKKFK